jgi:hypothetical protein
MDGNRFDALTRQLARTTSRRRAVAAIVVGATGALRPGRVPNASAQISSCAGKAAGQSCGQCGTCMELPASGEVECIALTFMCRGGGHPDDAACVHCDPATFTCRPPRECGPCEKCFVSGAAGTGCTYVAKGRDGQCDPQKNPCDPATGKCRCARDLQFCDPECVDVQTDPRHCGRCDRPCRACEHCREGACVPCDEACERCDGERGCVSTCEDQCLTCLEGQCVKPDPPICVCETEEEGGAPPAKRIYLPIAAAAGTDPGELQQCGEGDKAQCCVPEECCGEGDKQQCCSVESCCGEGADAECCQEGFACLEASEGGQICCMPELVCGDVCCAGGEECVSPGCCCWGPDITPQGACVQCRSGGLG